MLLKAVEFCLITFGLCMVVAFFVAAIIKAIAAVIGRGEKSAAGNNSK